MKNIRSFESFVNEGVRDQMTPKGKEDIKKSLEGSPALTVLKGIEEHDLGGVYTENELKQLRDRAKRYLNRLSVEKRIETLFGGIKDPLSIYTEKELKKIIGQIDGTDEELETISNYDLYHLYTKEEIKEKVEQFLPHLRFRIINNNGLSEFFTDDELDGYMEESDSTQIYSYFKDMVRRNEFEKVKRIMDKWNISFRNQDTNLVEYAVMSSNLEMVKYLFEKGLKADIIFDYLFGMMKRGADKEIIKYILSQSPELQRGFQEKKRIIKWETETIEKYS